MDDYKLILKANRKIIVLQTSAGVQIWIRGKRIKGASLTCLVCGKKIGRKPFFVPMAGETLPNPTERIHARCVHKLVLLPMEANTLANEEEKPNGKNT